MCYMGNKFVGDEDSPKDHFPNTKQGRKQANEYLIINGFIEDEPFWFHPSSTDILNYANKLYKRNTK